MDTRNMESRPQRTRSRRFRRPKRVLLVGLTPMLMRLLEGPLSDVADVSCVPFPGDAFDSAVRGYEPDLVVVDVTYLDEALVRPVITSALQSAGPIVVFMSDGGSAWFDDLGSGISGMLRDPSVSGLLQLIAPPALRLVSSH